MSGMLGSNEESFTCINHLIEEKKGDKDDEGYRIEKHMRIGNLQRGES